MRLFANVPLVAAILAASLDAQSPRLRATAAASMGLGVDATVLFDLFGPPAAPFALLLDIESGPTVVLDETLSLGFTPAFAAPFTGPLDASGFQRCALVLRPQVSLIGRSVYSQAIVLDAGAPNGFFAPSNGESTVFFGSATAIVERFDDAAAEGYVGSYDQTADDALTGIFETRLARTIDQSQLLEPPAPGLLSNVPLPFNGSIQSPLDPRGCRGQYVYRPQNLGAAGEPEVLTKILWRVNDGSPAFADTFDEVTIRVSHSSVSPNYSIGDFSALPAFPNSGLSSTFASNPSSPEIVVRTGPYAVDPNDLLIGLDPVGVGRYLDYGIEPRFTYNGVDSLLIDVRTPPSPTSNGFNGAQVFLAVSSDARPASRNVAALPPAQAGTLDPDAVTNGNFVDNTLHDVILEFARVQAEALSPFRASGSVSPDYDPPIVGAVVPGDSRIEFQFRGADDALGSNPTSFSADINLADGKPFLQIAILLIADATTGEVPKLDTLVVPMR